jgi:hypothetical protein
LEATSVGGELLKARIVPERIEDGIEAERGRSERNIFSQRTSCFDTLPFF